MNIEQLIDHWDQIKPGNPIAERIVVSSGLFELLKTDEYVLPASVIESSGIKVSISPALEGYSYMAFDSSGNIIPANQIHHRH